FPPTEISSYCSVPFQEFACFPTLCYVLPSSPESKFRCSIPLCPVSGPVPIPVPNLVPIPVLIPAPIPVPIPVPNPVLIPVPIPVRIPVPTPVPIPLCPVSGPVPIPLCPVSGPVPIPVPNLVPIPVLIPAPIPVPIPVPNPVLIPVPIPVSIPVRIPVPTPVPIPVLIPVPTPTPVLIPVPIPVPIPAMSVTRYGVGFSFVALFPFFHLGYDVAFALCADLVRRDLHLTESHQNYVVDVTQRYSISAAFLAGFAINFIGRKAVIIVGLSYYVVGALVSSIGWTYAVVTIGRMLMGVGIGIGLTSGPIYVAEIAPAEHRGLLLSFSQPLYTFGLLSGYTVQFFAETHLNTHSGWRVLIGIGAIPCSVLLLKLGIDRACFKESPCWLVMRGKLAQADTVLERCGAGQDERLARLDQLTYLAGISPALTGEDEVQVTSVSVTMRPMWAKLFFPTYTFLGTLAFVAALLSFQHFSGAHVALELVAAYVLETGSDTVGVLVTGHLLCGLVRIVAFTAPHVLVDIKGRRWAMLLSTGVTTCVLGVLGGLVTAHTPSDYWVAMAAVVQGAHVLGLGVVPWVYGPETFEFWVRGPAVGISVAISQGLAVIIQEKSAGLLLKIGDGGIYFVCGGMMVLAFLCCLLFIRDKQRHVLLDRMP
ncbi:Polyol transporter 5, partial [Linum perenne]